MQKHILSAFSLRVLGVSHKLFSSRLDLLHASEVSASALETFPACFIGMTIFVYAGTDYSVCQSQNATRIW